MDTSDIRKNVKLMLDGSPYTVVDFQFVKPGKGQAFTRVKIRNLATGAILERTFKSGEKLEPAIEAALEKIMPPGAPPLALFTTLARNPRVFQRFMSGGLLDRGSIALREREIVIARATARCGAEYEWGVHVAFFGARVGFEITTA